MQRDLALAHELADLAASISLPRFRAADLRVERKPDLTPVTESDRAVERALRERLERERPGDAITGEEEESDRLSLSGFRRRWIVDPIDGTKNYSRGIPAWFTLVALERDGELAVAVADAPALGRRWWATRGGGAFADGEPIRVSAVARLEDAAVSAPALAGRVWHAQQFADAWAHLLVAEGALDGALDPVMAPWDVAAPALVVAEAGGRATDLSGAVRIDGGSLLSSNGVLHDELLRELGRPHVEPA